MRSRETVRIGENLRQAILRARTRDKTLTNLRIAEEAHIHQVTLSRILAGYGASPETICRIAGVIGADGDKVLTKGLRKPLYSVRTIEEVIDNDTILSQFIGGGDEVAIDWARKRLQNIFDQCRKRRSQLLGMAQ